MTGRRRDEFGAHGQALDDARPVRRAVLVALALATVACKDDPEERVGPFREPDPEMRAAMRAARAGLDRFFRVFDDPSRGEHGFAVKIGVIDSRPTRYFWLEELERAEGGVSGVIDRKPLLNLGRAPERVRADHDAIVDWLYLRDGKVHGYFTLRPSMKAMTPSELEKAQGILERLAE